MILLAIDQSLSSSGIVITSDNAIIPAIIKTPSDMEVLERIQLLMRGLRYLIASHNVTHIALESLPQGMNSPSVRPLAGVFYTIQLTAKELNIPCQTINVKQVKKFATGSGAADKTSMIEAFKQDAPDVYHRCLVDLNVKKTTGLADIADAYWIGKLAKELYDKDQPTYTGVL